MVLWYSEEPTDIKIDTIRGLGEKHFFKFSSRIFGKAGNPIAHPVGLSAIHRTLRQKTLSSHFRQPGTRVATNHDMKTIKHSLIILFLLSTAVAQADTAFAESAQVNSRASTLTANPDTDWDYISIRRLFLYIEQGLRTGLQWTAFEQDTPALRASIVYDVSSFLHQLYTQGALTGETSDQAYWVTCEASPEDVNNGRLIVVVNVAPVKAGEFVTMRLILSVVPSE